MLSYSKNVLNLRVVLGYTGVILGLSLFVIYVLFQARFLILGPQITLNKQETMVYNSRTVSVEGTAQNIVSITLNGRAIYTDEDGYFNETLILENGYTRATLKAYDRYGRQTTKTISFVYRPEEQTTN